MKISLVNPPNIERTGTFRPPINIAGLAAYVRQHNHEPRIYDYEAEGKGIDDIEEMSNVLMQDKPDVIGFSCMSPRFPVIVDIARACKCISKEVIILLGGPHVTGDPESAFLDESIDYAIVGEGEEALLELLDSLEKGQDVSSIQNLAFRKNDSIAVNPVRPFIKNLDDLPLPAWDLLPIELYKDPAMFHGGYMGINSARGCAWNCNFCASKVIWKRKVRMRSAENVVDEIKFLYDEYGISEFMFYDDTFTINKKRILKMAELIEQCNIDIGFYASLRADTIDLQIAAVLKKMGCRVVFLGVESGDEKILKQTGKGVTKDQIRSSVKILKKVGIPFYASLIIGHPGDDHDSIQKTIDFAKELSPDQVKFLICTPYPGTSLHSFALEKGLLSKPSIEGLIEYSTYQHIAANLSCVSDEELLMYQKKAYEEYDLIKKEFICSHKK